MRTGWWLGAVSAPIVVSLSLLGCGNGSTSSTALGSSLSTATLENITQINEDGFGDPYNKYCWSSALFGGDIYVGTLNASGPVSLWAFMFELPFETNGAQIWKGTQAASGEWTWRRVLTDGGPGGQTTFGVRKMIVVGDYIYAVTADYTLGFELWRSADGENWTTEIEHGYGDANSGSGRGLAVYDGYLYVGVSNHVAGASLLRRAIDSTTGDYQAGSSWELAYSAGADGPSWFTDITVLDDQMYMGTLSLLRGPSILRTAGAIASDGSLEFDTVWEQTARESGNTAVMKLYAYDGYLYAGTQDFISGAWLLRSPSGDPDSWETLMTQGDGDRNNQYFWYMEEFADRLYVSTYNLEEGYWLMSTTDGTSYVDETQDGLGETDDFGIRTMQVLSDRGGGAPDLLIFGTATSRRSAAAKLYTAEAR